MSLILSRLNLNQIHHHLESMYPQEGCGLLIGVLTEGKTVIHQVIATENVWDNLGETDGKPDHSTRDRYEISPKAMLWAMKSARENNLEIVGVYHSHPDHPAIPSECDRRLAWAQYIYIICSVDRGTVRETTAWQLDDQQQFRSVSLTV
jgi:proteasome lid subunit RPN8/RPN11